MPATVRGQLQDLCNGVGNSAWHGFFGWFGVLLALIGAVLLTVTLFAPTVKLPVPVRLAVVGLFALALISTLLALLVVPDGDYNGQRIPSDSKTFDAGHGFSYWIVLVLIIIGTVLAVLRFLQSGEQLRSRGGSRGLRDGGATTGGGSTAPGGGAGAPSGYEQQPPQGPPPGYGQQPPQGPPQGPPPGYGQQPPQGPPQGPTPGYTPPPQ